MSNEVAIFKDANERLKVVPDYVFLKKQGKVKFHAVNTEVVLIFTKLDLEGDGTTTHSFTVQKGGKKVISLKKPEDVTTKEYPYTVICPETNETLKGSSPPSMIIIDDP